MARTKQPPRPLPPNYPTGTAKRVAEAGDRYYTDGDDLGRWGIYDRKTQQFDARPGMTASQVYAEVARLNAGLPVSSVSQGIGRGAPAVTKGSPAWWAELLTRTEPTRTILEDAIRTGRALSADDVLELMTYHDDTGVDFRASFPFLPTQRPLPAPPKPPRLLVTDDDERRHKAAVEAYNAKYQRLKQVAEDDLRKLVEAVSQQLKRVFRIRLKDGRNQHRAAKKLAR